MARIAGFTFLFYIAVALPGELLLRRATRGADTPARLATIAAHFPYVRTAILLTFLSSISALVLAVALYALTRDDSGELAVLTLVSRTCEGALGMLGVPNLLQLIEVARLRSGSGAMDAGTVNVLGTYLLMPGQGAMLGAPFFAVGSLAFCWSLLRGSWFPRILAWIGCAASALLVVGLPLALAGLLPAWLQVVLWLPALAFEVPAGLWLLVKFPKGTPTRGP
jgi:hypothetical protein